MSGEARRWLQYAWENRQIAQISLERGLFNPCLQNAQQAVEKALKALWIAEGLPLKKTHSIQELTGDLRHRGIDVELEDDDCELLDSVYLPSKYPLGSALPDFEPDEAVAPGCAFQLLSESWRRSNEWDRGSDALRHEMGTECAAVQSMIKYSRTDL